MRLLTVFLVLVCFPVLSLAQTTVVRAQAIPGCCGPYIPLVTTPMISLQSVSPNSVGARNATWGLVAGASNSTLSMVSGDTNSSYTQPVWYEGGTTPLISHPSVELGVHPMRMEMREHMQHMEAELHGHAASRGWTYYAPSEQAASAVEASAAARGSKRATRTITNQDIDQQNTKTGTVKYDGKTEQLK